MGISLLELVNYVLILILVVVIFAREGWRRHYWLFAGYLLLVGVYCVIHSYNVGLFDVSLLKREPYSLVKESYYIARTYMLPLLFLVLVYKSRLDQKKFYKIIEISVFMITGILILTNFLGIAITAYGDEFHKQMIQGNVFSWFQFKEGADFELYTSKGRFSSANQISGVLFFLSPLVIKQMLEDTKGKNIILACMCMLSMIMLGTKTATFGFFLVLIILVMASVMLHKWKKTNIQVKKSLCAAGVVLIFGKCSFILLSLFTS